jgi:hypothetical protein
MWLRESLHEEADRCRDGTSLDPHKDLCTLLGILERDNPIKQISQVTVNVGNEVDGVRGHLGLDLNGDNFWSLEACITKDGLDMIDRLLRIQYILLAFVHLGIGHSSLLDLGWAQTAFNFLVHPPIRFVHDVDLASLAFRQLG